MEQKDTLDLEEMRLLLVNNMFEEVDPENEERLESFYTPFQIKLRLKVPVDTAEFNVALQMLGLRGYYKGHTIPMNPDNASFMIKENPDGEKFIQILIPKSKLDEVESFIEEDDNFNKYMRDMCEKDAIALIKENDFLCFSILTSGPSEHFSDVMTYAATEIKNNMLSPRKAHLYLDHKWTEKEIEDYTTPYKEGVQSSFERLGIAVPGMVECVDYGMFTETTEALRTYYKICKGKNVVVDDPVKVKNFMGKLLEKKQISVENNIDIISQNYISLRRASKYLFNEYHNLYELSQLLKHNRFKPIGAIGEAELISEVVVKLKINLETILKEKEEREMK